MLYLYAPKYGDEKLPLTYRRDDLDQFEQCLIVVDMTKVWKSSNLC